MGGDVFRDEYSLAFDGSDTYINIGNPAALQLGVADITFSFWAKQSSGDAGYLISKRDTGGGGFSVYVESDGQHGFYNGTSSIAGANFGNPWSYGVWNHLVMVYDHSGGSVTKYLNGKLDAQNTSLGTASNTDDDQAWRINGRFTAGDAMSGNSDITQNLNISEVVIYNKSLSSSEVATIYNGREPYNHKEGICSSNLKAWWRMGDGDSDTYPLINDQTNQTFGADIVEAHTTDLGSFDTDTTASWSVQNEDSWSYNAGTGDATYVADGTGGGNAIYKGGLLTIAQAYKLTFKMKSSNVTTAPKIYYGIVDSYISPSDGKTLSTSYQTFTHYFVAAHVSLYIANGVGMDSGKDFTVDDIVVVPANGNAGIMTNMAVADIVGDTP
tara:strand:- start:558 stop:1709 length:1152 start_codon:yes stop_codon:yes gene_type:complete